MGPLHALEELLEGFTNNPLLSVVAMRQLMDHAPEPFIRASLALAGQAVPKAARHPWGALLATRHELLPILCDPMESALAPAVSLARVVCEVDPTFEAKLMKRLDDAAPDHRAAVAYRVLELVEHVTQGPKVLHGLMHLAGDPDRWIRSKVALIIGRWRHDPRLIARCLNDPDPRVRANAVESLWGAGGREACDEFRSAISDFNHRVSANGVVGLHLAGVEPTRPLLETMISHQDQLFQAAGAWATGRCREVSLRDALRRLASGFGPQRRTAIRALAELRAAESPHGEQPAPAGDRKKIVNVV